MQNSKEKSVTDETTRKIHEYVSRVRVQPEVRQEYMKYEEIIAYERRDAAEKAAQETAVWVKRKDILELLEDYGDIPQSLREKIGEESSEAVLKKWLKLAAKVDNIAQFVENM